MGANGLTFSEAQAEMRAAYVNGAPGVLVSGLVWLGSAAAARLATFETGVAVLFFGGMAIFPVGLLLAKTLFRAPSVGKGNGLNGLAMQSTVGLIAGFLLAWVAAMGDQAWFYPAMQVVIGSRYFVFATVYGRAPYMVLGGALLALGSASLVALKLEPWIAAAAGGAIEVVFGIILFATHRRGASA